jgi:uncharacterized membrane protein
MGGYDISVTNTALTQRQPAGAGAPRQDGHSAKQEVRFALARTRLLMAAAVGTVVFAVAMLLTAWQVALLAGWSAVGLVFAGWTIISLWTLDATDTAQLATKEDSSRAVADVLLLSAETASLAAIGLGLAKAASSKGAGQALITALAVFTVVVSWAVVHTVFALRYASLYYRDGRGVDFNEDAKPDYRDFAYLALTIGMTFQVSDTDLQTKAIRHTAIRHALMSYLFGAVVIAMVINVVAGLLNGG